MTQIQTGVVTKATGNTYTAAEFNDVNDTINDNATDAESRFSDSNFTVLTANGELTSDRSSYDTAVEGTGAFTLPAPTSGLNGSVRGLWTTGAFTSTGYISIIGDINGKASNERRMGIMNEYTKFVCDGVTWREDGHNTQSFCTPQITSPTTFALTTSFAKLTSWDTNPVFETPGRLEWDKPNNQIRIPIIEGLVQDGFGINLVFIVEYTNNRTVSGIIAIDGAQTNGEFVINGLGSGKPVELEIPLDIGVLIGESTLEVQLKGEISGTLDILSARWTVQRIKG